ncbi:MAG: hypothetical protein LUG24_10515 [Clostridiales bacterium]|nr:hypothetical protein [Clostridiales bacterium]
MAGYLEAMLEKYNISKKDAIKKLLLAKAVAIIFFREIKRVPQGASLFSLFWV